VIPPRAFGPEIAGARGAGDPGGRDLEVLRGRRSLRSAARGTLSSPGVWLSGKGPGRAAYDTIVRRGSRTSQRGVSGTGIGGTAPPRQQKKRRFGLRGFWRGRRHTICFAAFSQVRRHVARMFQFRDIDGRAATCTFPLGRLIWPARDDGGGGPLEARLALGRGEGAPALRTFPRRGSRGGRKSAPPARTVCLPRKRKPVMAGGPRSPVQAERRGT